MDVSLKKKHFHFFFYINITIQAHDAHKLFIFIYSSLYFKEAHVSLIFWTRFHTLNLKKGLIQFPVCCVISDTSSHEDPQFTELN